MRNFNIEPFYYDEERKLFENDNFTIEKGLTVLVGPNGTGKSTLLKHIAYKIKELNDDSIEIVQYDNFGKRFIRTLKPIVDNPDKKELWILVDGIDSGLSIDMIEEIKGIFRLILEDAKKDKDVYIVVSANSYTMSEEVRCFDVTTLYPISFSSYDEYKEFIIKNRKKKDEQLKEKE